METHGRFPPLLCHKASKLSVFAVKFLYFLRGLSRYFKTVSVSGLPRLGPCVFRVYSVSWCPGSWNSIAFRLVRSIPTYPHQRSPGIRFNKVWRRFAFYLSCLNHTVAIGRKKRLKISPQELALELRRDFPVHLAQCFNAHHSSGHRR